MFRPWASKLKCSASGGWREVTGPLVIVGSMLLALTIVILSSQTVGEGPGSPWLPQSWALGRTIPNASSTTTIAPPFRNITGQIVDELKRNGTSSCHKQHTNITRVIGFPNTEEVIFLPTNVVHRFWLQSYTSSGESRCAGGDYYETDLASHFWKSRPPVEDLQNGTYAVHFIVPDAFSGPYNFSASLLFDAYHGLDRYSDHWLIAQQTVLIRLYFFSPTNSSINFESKSFATKDHSMHSSDYLNPVNLKQCGSGDFGRSEWSGRWTRPSGNDSCPVDSEKRYVQCYPQSGEPCKIPSWCIGNTSRLESIGWSYSAHCAFKIYEAQEAWDCLSGRWLYFWGDSNFQDTIRNLLFFVLNISPAPGQWLHEWQFSRTFEGFFRNPDKNFDQELRISLLFNGHKYMNENSMGLETLRDSYYREYLKERFESKSYPDVVIMNSGLHDGGQMSIVTYVDALDRAVEFWGSVLGNVTGKPPKLVYKTTIAPAGSSRGMWSNPWKMEVYNKIITERMQARFPNIQVVDAFDLSFPWHYDNNYSDGGHYGRPPGSKLWPWSGQPHHYFVDIMLVHILLNSICPL